jgi:hypothetical protein
MYNSVCSFSMAERSVLAFMIATTALFSYCLDTG